MPVSITVNGDLTLDQTPGIQDDDVDLQNTVNPNGADTLTGGLDTDFLSYLNGLSPTLLTDDQKVFAALVDGASETDLVTVTTTAGETISDLFFSDANGQPFNGTQVFITPDDPNTPEDESVPLQTTGGDNIYLWSALGGDAVLATTSNVSATAGSAVAAFFLKENDTSTSATVQSVTFLPLQHPDPDNPDDTVNFSDILKVSANASLSFNFDSLKSGDHLWVAVGSSTAGVLVSGENLDVDAAGKKTNASDTIHTSQGGQGATIGVNNQLFDNAGETAVFTLVSGFTSLVNANGAGGDYVVDPKPQDNKPEGIDYGGYLNVTGAGVFISQSQGNNLKDLDINVFEAGGGTAPEEKFGYIPGLASDTPIDVATVSVFAPGSTTPIGVWSISPTGTQLASGDSVGNVQVTIADNNIDVNGLLGGYTVDWTVVDGETFNRFNVVQEGGQFDVGRVDITQGLTVSTSVGDNLLVDDDGPSIVTALPVDPVEVENTAPVNSGPIDFVYKIGSDANDYVGGESDFVDTDGNTAGVQIDLTGTVGSGPDNAIVDPVVTLFTEDKDSAVFNFSFDYDTNPIQDGVQHATAEGTLTFDKVLGTVTFALDNPIEGFDFSILHTSELQAKNPIGNTGHPPMVVEQLDTDFFVQFTADALGTGKNPTLFSFSNNGDTPNTGDTEFGGLNDPHDLVGGQETWVSATQSTNGVAGDTIQQGENLTLRFFGEDVLSQANPPGSDNGHTTPDTSVDGIAIKFDGIGANEDLIVILDLVDDKGTASTADDTFITRAITVDNADIFKHAEGVPSPYDQEFSLDNNDGLLIIENNDYQFAGEHYQIQGLQIMQSANGLTGTGIDLNGDVGANGGSDLAITQSFTDASFHTTDVLKITDIGFIEHQTGSQDASLDFQFQLTDTDSDTTALQQLLVDVLNA